jgi:hypothetical protein
MEGDVRMFRITATLGGMVPMVTTNSATRIPRTIAGKRFQKRLNIELSAFEQQYHLGVQRHPSAEPSRSADKAICFRELPIE